MSGPDAGAAVVSPQRGQATAGHSVRRHLSLSPGRIMAEGPNSPSPVQLHRSLARDGGQSGDAAMVVLLKDQRTDEAPTHRHAVREWDQPAAEARLGGHLVRRGDHVAFGRITDRPLVPVPDRGWFPERPASQAANEGAEPAPNAGFPRRAERRASHGAAAGDRLRHFERRALQQLPARVLA